jgi:cbb3-type cytochrome oxidase subunit 1
MNLTRAFLLTALVYAMIGMTLGIYMGITGNFAPAPVHAHINLVGWVSLALFGLIHRAYPQLRAQWLAKVQFWVAQAGALLLPIGIWLKLSHDIDLVVVLGSLLTIAATFLFLVLALNSLHDD